MTFEFVTENRGQECGAVLERGSWRDGRDVDHVTWHCARFKGHEGPHAIPAPYGSRYEALSWG